MESAIEVMQGAQVGEAVEKPAPLAVPEPVKTAPPVAAHAAGVASLGLPRTLEDVMQYAQIMHASGAFKDVRSPAQAALKIIAGCALGYSPDVSMNAFYFIDGRVTPTAGEVRARIKRAGYRLKEWEIDSAGDRVDPIKPNGKTVNGAVVVIREKVDGVWEDLEPAVFTMQDAITAGLASKDNWKKYAKAMYSARALTIAARKHCSEVFGGPVYLAEELNPDLVLEMDSEGALVPASNQVTLESPALADRKPLTVMELTALYVDARKLDPTLPENMKLWVATVLEGYDPAVATTLKKGQLLTIEDRLREMLAAGVPAGPETPSGTAVASPMLGETPPQPAASEPEIAQGELLPPEPTKGPPAAPEPVEAKGTSIIDGLAPEEFDEAAARFGSPPANEGPPMERKTQGRLFAALTELGVPKEKNADGTIPRHSWAMSFGVEVPKDATGRATFSALCEPLALWLADRACDEVRLLRMKNQGACAACGAVAGKPHDDDCSELGAQ